MNHEKPTFSSSLPSQTEPFNLSSAGKEWNNGLSRRSFLKRTGGATVGLIIANHVFAQGPVTPPAAPAAGSGETLVPVNSHMYRTTTQKWRLARDANSNESWIKQGDPSVSLSVGANGTDGKSPGYLTEPEAPEGYPVKKGWVESVNDLLEKIKNTLPGAGNPTETETVTPSSTNNGEGTPPTGYQWTTSTKTTTKKEKVPYTRNYKFAKQ